MGRQTKWLAFFADPPLPQQKYGCNRSDYIHSFDQ